MPKQQSVWMKLRFSLIELLLLMIPAGLLFLWIGDLQRTKEIEWQDFSLASAKTQQEKGFPIIVHCIAETFSNLNPPLPPPITPEQLRNIDTGQFVAYRYEFIYWKPDKWTPETEWAVEHGAGKYPSLILVARDGSTRNLGGFNIGKQGLNSMVDFMDLSKNAIYRANVLFGLLVGSLIATIVVFFWRRRDWIKSAKGKAEAPIDRMPDEVG